MKLLKRMQGQTIILILLLLPTGCSRDLTRHEGITAVDVEDGWYLTELAWSPDGRQIAATVDTRHPHAIYVIDLETKDHHSVQDYGDRNLHEAYGAEWSPDGHSLVLFYPADWIAASAADPFVPTSPYDIVIVSAETGEITQGVVGIWRGSYATRGDRT